MFTLIDIGERAGSGIPSIFSVWSDQGWAEPKYTEELEPDRVTLSLDIENASDKAGDNVSDKILLTSQQESVRQYLSQHGEGKASEIANLLGVSPSRARAILSEMVTQNILEGTGANRNRPYKLKN